MTNNDIQTLLEYAGKLEWQPIGTAPTDGTHYLGAIIQPDGTFGEAFESVYDGEHVCVTQTEYIPHKPTHWMPLPDGSAGAVIRELVLKLDDIAILLNNGIVGDSYGNIVGNDMAQQSLAKAAALIANKE